MTDKAGSFNFDQQAMRQLGYRVVDLIVDHQTGMRSKPVARRRERAVYDRRFAAPPPRTATDPQAVLSEVAEHVLTGIAHTDHPRFYGYVPGPGNYVSVLGDALAAGFNVFAGHSLVGSSAAAIESITLGWLRDLMGMPSTAGGIFLSGGSMAGLSALHVARTRALGAGVTHDPTLAVYGTTEAHSSLAKALRTLGFGNDQLRLVPIDDSLRMNVQALAEMVRSDRINGLRPLAVIATAGTTSTGTVDPLLDIRRLCDDENLWMHVDGAYGGAARIGTCAKTLLDGLGMADSLVLDPHKWLFQPYEIGCLLVRDARSLKAAFAVEAEYLREAAASASSAADGLAGAINFYDYGPQLTRSFRALTLWMFLKTFGLDHVEQAIDRGIKLAEAAEAHISASSEWQIVTPAQIGILTFRSTIASRRRPQVIKRAVQAGLDEGYALITTTEVRGETVFRLCPIHPDAQFDEVATALNKLAVALGENDENQGNLPTEP
ncbi:aminotransferase class I/II-fold pyridoxal phosphate-dependent enzyme [Sphingomonas ursincola]|uniref:Aspartate aminotransferase family protein n=1 Tax=Sphingomonas ursincola TaxID=56361 RepID=A0A7V8RG98_9SPHN|nr:aminotransferase class V-fold PLP-dependent enzyme [Sphingomonas ursincola]MBA1375888.1 aspartate aminotransferase family protein [Sphingomonas ursincola]